ncbi:hypothetical protein [Aeoliella mucimassa]|uniref:HEAT repeat protein n=1 Tax=Aeoliella mucimassa TaxID=2527972 RepID=A0A518AUJ0_9BACT|nr:hypothetical protein [Aeoliella mucimassa]QDU58375.1 hypothetical protein Pan181_46090 [Aeoliella mucimassa]
MQIENSKGMHHLTCLNRLSCCALAVALLTSCGWAEELPTAVPAAAAAESPGFYAGTMQMLRRCRLRCKNSNAGKMLANMVEPFSKMTGGIIPSCKGNEFDRALELHASAPVGASPGGVPAPPPPPPPAVAAAAKIKAEQQQAEIRKQAVAYLAGVDCRYYPEAEGALIASLRADRSECVRLEAAKVLLGCSCRSPAVVKALTICAAGSDADGNPGEQSTRVRMMALQALQCCQTCDDTELVPTTPPEQPLGSTQGSQDAQQVSFEQTTTVRPVELPPVPAQRGGSLSELWGRSAD